MVVLAVAFKTSVPRFKKSRNSIINTNLQNVDWTNDLTPFYNVELIV